MASDADNQPLLEEKYPVKVRKRPVEVEAWPVPLNLTYGNRDAVHRLIAWCGGLDVAHLEDEQDCTGNYNTVLVIETLEGPLRAPPGWWIIRGVRGEFYPCESEIFGLTYEAVVE